MCRHVDFDDDAATAVAIIVGVLIIFVAAITNGPTSLVDSLPVSVHLVLDYALAAVHPCPRSWQALSCG